MINNIKIKFALVLLLIVIRKNIGY